MMERALINLPSPSWCRCPPYHTRKRESLSSPAAVEPASETFGLSGHISTLPSWKLGLYHSRELAVYEETYRQQIQKDNGCRKQQAAGDTGCIMTFSPF